LKYLILLCDGMSDHPTPALENRTPMELAFKPTMDHLGAHGFAGLVRTIPYGISPGSDTANMSVMGYDPRIYYTGRSPIEAISMGLSLSDEDMAFRVNLVNVSDEIDYTSRIMVDYSADEISSFEAAELIKTINQHFSNHTICFYPGKSYRHCLIWKNGPIEGTLVPPHDILTRQIGDYLPGLPHHSILRSMMMDSICFLNNHPVNQARVQRGLLPANAIWIWGQGKRPSLPKISEKYHIRGSVIAAVDLIFGLGVLAGMQPVPVEGATGNIHTNFSGKANAAISEFEKGVDYVYLHIEAPDECGHRNEPENKIRSIELIDEKVLSPLFQYLQKKSITTCEDFRILVLPDHSTPLVLRTHTAEPVPFILYSSDKTMQNPVQTFTEKACLSSNVMINSGPELFDLFMGKNSSVLIV
jgi:2,3-bisphosphoglycerate-independent phosphoglycerate mutase